MKYIFLDFDGVVNHWGKFYGVAKENALILKKLVELSHASIIATTSNKYSFQRENGIPYLKSNYYQSYIKEFHQYGIFISDITPYVKGNRSLEIKQYLKEHPTEQYVILDDELVDQELQDHQVFLDLYRGLREEHIAPSIQILNGKLGFYPKDYNRNETEEEHIYRLNRYYKRG